MNTEQAVPSKYVDAQKKHATHPETFDAPTRDELNALKTGDKVKARFKTTIADFFEEREGPNEVWYNVLQFEGNDLICENFLKQGETVTLQTENVLQIASKPEPTPKGACAVTITNTVSDVAESLGLSKERCDKLINFLAFAIMTHVEEVFIDTVKLREEKGNALQQKPVCLSSVLQHGTHLCETPEELAFVCVFAESLMEKVAQELAPEGTRLFKGETPEQAHANRMREDMDLENKSLPELFELLSKVSNDMRRRR